MQPFFVCRLWAIICLPSLGPSLSTLAAELQFGEVEVVVGPTIQFQKTRTPGELNAPFAMEFNAQGDMILVEYDGGRVLSWSTTTGLIKLAGDGKLGYVDGAAERARFNKLHNLAITNDGRYLLSDHENHAIRVYDPKQNSFQRSQETARLERQSQATTLSEAKFNQPICISLSPKKDSLLIADINNRVIRRLTFSDNSVTIVVATALAEHRRKVRWQRSHHCKTRVERFKTKRATCS